MSKKIDRFLSPTFLQVKFLAPRHQQKAAIEKTRELKSD